MRSVLYGYNLIPALHKLRSMTTGAVIRLAFIPPHETGGPHGAVGEGIAVDIDVNVHGAEGPLSQAPAGGGLTKYVR